MARELLIDGIPEDLRDKMSPFVNSVEGIRELLSNYEDPTHRKSHVIECLFSLHWAWEENLNIDPLTFYLDGVLHHIDDTLPSDAP